MTQHRAGTDETAEPGPPLEDKVAFLRSAAAYEGVAEVEARETRMAWVFLAGRRVYKLKKPVRHPFLDYTTRAARRWACEEEVRLNRRLAPDVYLGVARLTRDAGGTLAIDGAGVVVDWLVQMRRLPRKRLLDQAIASGTVSRSEIEVVADRLARFYAQARSIRIDPAGRLTAMAQTVRASGDVLADARFASLAETGSRTLAALDDLLTRTPALVSRRIAAGRIVEGHGDLKPEHVCLTEPPVIIDCLEFSRELRLVDPFDELSYLSMECDALGARWIGPLVIGRCAEALDDRPSAETLAFYRAYRAALRARQSLEHLLEPRPRTPAKWLPKARGYLAEAERALLTLRPR